MRCWLATRSPPRGTPGLASETAALPHPTPTSQKTRTNPEASPLPQTLLSIGEVFFVFKVQGKPTASSHRYCPPRLHLKGAKSDPLFFLLGTSTHSILIFKVPKQIIKIIRLQIPWIRNQGIGLFKPFVMGFECFSLQGRGCSDILIEFVWIPTC